MAPFWAHVGISGLGVISVIISASVLYLVVSLTLRFWGRPSLRPSSPLTLALITLVGAVAARSILGEWPTLAGGVVAIATLMVWERGLGRRRVRRAVGAAVIMVGASVRTDELRRHRVSEDQLWARLRQAGIRRADEVGAVIVEADGSLSVLRSDEPTDERLLAGVRGTDDLPAELLRA